MGVQEQIRALVELAEIDASAQGLDSELKAIPAQLDESRMDVQRVEALLGAERAQAADAERVRDEQMEEIARRQEAVNNARAKAAKAVKAREAEAAERELEANRRAIREREEEIARLEEALTKVRASLSQHEGEFSELQDLFSEEERGGRERTTELERKRAEALAGRDKVSQNLPKQVLRRYELLQSRKPPAVAEVKEGTCIVCRIQLPPQEYNVLLRGEELMQCPSCRRMLFHRELL